MKELVENFFKFPRVYVVRTYPSNLGLVINFFGDCRKINYYRIGDFVFFFFVYFLLPLLFFFMRHTFLVPRVCKCLLLLFFPFIKLYIYCL